ncbi:unnamed protein product [Polarella glacialis]|uniref:Uncharacterized protein n=1 Tax=Polarella glacialis TaxID=89957 RepID=A0A813IK98_POLGL|nr:unnamed protein product [Polarella glacialis]
MFTTDFHLVVVLCFCFSVVSFAAVVGVVLLDGACRRALQGGGASGVVLHFVFCIFSASCMHFQPHDLKFSQRVCHKTCPPYIATNLPTTHCHNLPTTLFRQ